MRNKNHKKISIEEKTEQNYKYINSVCNITIFLSAFNILMLILANLDNLVSFANYIISYLH